MRKQLALILFSITTSFVAAQPGSGNCLQFTGSNYVDCGNPAGGVFDFTGAGTIEAWVKVSSTPPPASGKTCYSILAKDESAGEFNKWIFGIQNGRLTFHINSPRANQDWVYSNPFTLAINKFYHFAMSKNIADQVTFFVNGTAMGTITLPNNTTFVNSNMVIGGSEPALEMSGEIDEVRLWKTVLTQNELREWMCRKVNAGHPSFASLVADYKLNEGAGAITRSQSGLAAALINTPVWTISGAPIGDSATVDFSSINKTTSMVNKYGEIFSAKIASGNPDGIIVYRVDESPNSRSGISEMWNNDAYFGVFIAEVNFSSATYTGQYEYSQNRQITNKNECTLKLFQRDNNAAVSWNNTGSSSNLLLHTFSFTGQTAEFIIAGDSTGQQAGIVIATDDADNLICKGAAVNFTASTTNAGFTADFRWLRNGTATGNNIPSYADNMIQGGDIIQCDLFNYGKCKVNDTIKSNIITLHSPNGVKLGKDTSFCIQDRLIIQVNDTFTVYKWNTGASTSSIIVNPPGIYWLQTRDKYGCLTADTITVAEKYCGFAIPTAFSPNGDLQNDVFKPVISGNLVKYSLVIYNRWGQKIYSTNKLMEGWTGNNQKQADGPGTYVWICEFQIAGQPLIQRKGTVQLIR